MLGWFLQTHPSVAGLSQIYYWVVKNRWSAAWSSMRDCFWVINDSGYCGLIGSDIVGSVGGWWVWFHCVTVGVNCWPSCIIINCGAGEVGLSFTLSVAEYMVVQDMFGSTAVHASSALISSWQLIISHWMALRSMAGCIALDSEHPWHHLWECPEWCWCCWMVFLCQEKEDAHNMHAMVRVVLLQLSEVMGGLGHGGKLL